MNGGDKRFFIHDAFTSIVIADKGMVYTQEADQAAEFCFPDQLARIYILSEPKEHFIPRLLQQKELGHHT